MGTIIFVVTKKQGEILTGYFCEANTNTAIPVNGRTENTTTIELLQRGDIKPFFSAAKIRAVERELSRVKIGAPEAQPQPRAKVSTRHSRPKPGSYIYGTHRPIGIAGVPISQIQNAILEEYPILKRDEIKERRFEDPSDVWTHFRIELNFPLAKKYLKSFEFRNLTQLKPGKVEPIPPTKAARTSTRDIEYKGYVLHPATDVLSGLETWQIFDSNGKEVRQPVSSLIEVSLNVAKAWVDENEKALVENVPKPIHRKFQEGDIVDIYGYPYRVLDVNEKGQLKIQFTQFEPPAWVDPAQVKMKQPAPLKHSPEKPTPVEKNPAPRLVNIDLAGTTDIIRAALKRKYPGTTFSVRTKRFAGGAEINVSYQGDLPEREVNQLIHQYESNGFDGMTDTPYYIHHWLMPDGSAVIAHVDAYYGSKEVFNPPPSPDAQLVRFTGYVHAHKEAGEPRPQKPVIVQGYGDTPPKATPSQKGETYKIGDATVVENREIDRIQIFFPGKPSQEIHKQLKAHGFRFASSQGNAWQRKLTSNAVHATRAILEGRAVPAASTHGRSRPLTKQELEDFGNRSPKKR